MESGSEIYTKRLLRFVTIGSVDDGKSTLIGRLLHDSKALLKDQYDAVKNIGQDKTSVNFAFFTDGLKSERELGITIDIAYRYFSTPKRKFIIADAPGHFEYTKNMITACSRAQVAVMMIDARYGIVQQTKRHLFFASLLQIKHVVICVNKMDLVGFDESRFEQVRFSCVEYASKLQITDLQFLPTVATDGDNIVNLSDRMPWYKGSTLLYYLENVHVESDENRIDCRLPVQYVHEGIKVNGISYTGYQGRVASGIFKQGDEVFLLPSQQKTRIFKIFLGAKEIDEAPPNFSIQLLLEGNPILKRGDMIVRPHNHPKITCAINCMVFWLTNEPLNVKKEYFLLQAHRQLSCQVKLVHYKINVDTLHREFPPFEIGANDIARVIIETKIPVYIDSYQKNKVTGSLILVDKDSLETVGAAVII